MTARAFTLGRVHLRALLTVGALAGALAATPLTPATSGSATAANATTAAAGPPSERPRHSSDGVAGEQVRPAPAHARRAPGRLVAKSSQKLAPGVRLLRQRRTDARGQYVVTALRVRWDDPRVRIDYLNPGKIASTATVRQMMARSPRAVAAINGDFFDMGRTGAPLGVGKGLNLPVLHGGTQSMHGTLYLSGARNRPRIEDLQPRARIAQHLDWPVTDVNSPLVDVDGIGLYTRAWGRVVGTRVAGGDRTGVRVAYLRKGKVARVTNKVSATIPNPGQVLVGRGAGAKLIATLRKGERVTPRWNLPAQVRPRVAMSGSQILATDGVLGQLDDTELHPRTAVGIDHDNNTMLFVAVDGRRRPVSRGLTLAELGTLMVSLGAEDALNLDGGGSTTLVAKGAAGRTRVRNTPSDGGERSVANALQIKSVPRRR